jgi:hypothetical protein
VIEARVVSDEKAAFETPREIGAMSLNRGASSRIESGDLVRSDGRSCRRVKG